MTHCRTHEFVLKISEKHKKDFTFVTVFSPINGQSKRQTPLISGQFFFHWSNSGQSLLKNFLKGGQVISGHSN